MVGEHADRKLKTKGAETWGVFLFLIDELKLHPVPNRRNLVEAATCVADVLQLWSTSAWVLTPSQIQTSFTKWSRFLALAVDIDDLHIPKTHMSMHLMRDLDWFGNPRYFANWVDESLNKTLRLACRHISQFTFDPCILSAMRELLKRPGCF